MTFRANIVRAEGVLRTALLVVATVVLLQSNASAAAAQTASTITDCTLKGAAEKCKALGITQCDVLAADPSDPDKPASVLGVTTAKLNFDEAIKACQDVINRNREAPRFQYQLGRALDAGGQTVKALAHYEMAANAGHALAAYILGAGYANSRYPTIDDRTRLKEAERWFKKSADLGNTSAQLSLSQLYLGAFGAKRNNNMPEALRLLQPLAEDNISLAEYILGVLYIKGVGVRQDIDKGISLVRAAAKAGCAEAQFSLGLLYSSGKLVQRNVDQGYKWIREAATRGGAKAIKYLQVAYGLVISLATNDAVFNEFNDIKEFAPVIDKAFGPDNRTTREALAWFKNRADSGDGAAKSMLGVLYGKGIIVGQDRKRAIQYLHSANEVGDHSGDAVLESLENDEK